MSDLKQSTEKVCREESVADGRGLSARDAEGSNFQEPVAAQPSCRTT